MSMNSIDPMNTQRDQHRLPDRQRDLFDTGWYCPRNAGIRRTVRISENYEPLPLHGITTPYNLTEYDELPVDDGILQCPMIPTTAVPNDDAEQNNIQ